MESVIHVVFDQVKDRSRPPQHSWWAHRLCWGAAEKSAPRYRQIFDSCGVDPVAVERVFRRAYNRVVGLFAEYDVIVGPAAPGAAPRGLEATGDPVLSRAWQALGLPVVTVPGLRDEVGLPLGIQVIGRPDGERELLAVSRWIETRLGASTPADR